jgi:histidine ammonia-lyase
MKLTIDGKSLTLKKIEQFVKENQQVVLSGDAKKRIVRARKLIDKWVSSGEAVYGVTTDSVNLQMFLFPKKTQRNFNAI